MENQHRIIKGYRDLSAEEIAMINEIKATGQAVQALIAKVAEHVEQQVLTAGDADELQRIQDAQPSRWTSIAKTDFQTGLMALTRAVAQPGTF